MHRQKLLQTVRATVINIYSLITPLYINTIQLYIHKKWHSIHSTVPLFRNRNIVKNIF